MKTRIIRCTINGRAVETAVDIRASLTDLLRGEYRLTSVKKGCEAGECGACNVIINGECFNSCIYLAVWADGKEITTTEGLLSASEIIRSGKDYSDEELRVLLSGHLCRCTGYENIFRAVRKLAGQKGKI